MIQLITRNRKRNREEESGFTLIELLVVIIILGILTAVVVFAVRGINNRGERQALRQDARTLRTANEAYCGKFGQYTTDENVLVQEGFLAEVSTYHDLQPVAPQSPTSPCGRYRVVCAPNSPCGPPPAPVPGGTLVMGMGNQTQATTMNPAISSEGGLHSRSEDIFNGLLKYDPNGSVQPDLAQSFNISLQPQGSPNCAAPSTQCTRAEFVLREGVKFHDGGTFGPDDVEFSFEKAILVWHGRSASLSDALGGSGSNYTKTFPADAITTQPAVSGLHGGIVVFNLRIPYNALIRQMNVTEAPILSKAVYEPCWIAQNLGPPNSADCAPNISPVGTGPFKFDSNTGSVVRTVKHTQYHRPGLPYFDAVEKRFDVLNVTQALEDGVVDTIIVPNQDLTSIQGKPEFGTELTPRGPGGGGCITTAAFNLTKRGDTFGQSNGLNNPQGHKILGDRKVRTAIFHALDRNKIWTDVNFRGGRVADAPIHSSIVLAWGSPKNLPAFDRTAANNLLDQAGWGGPRTNIGGFQIRTALNHPNENNTDPDLVVADNDPLTLQYTFANGNQTMAQELQSQLRQVGVNLTLDQGDNFTHVAPKTFGTRDFDMSQISYCNNEDPQLGVRRQYYSAAVNSANFTNASGYKDAAMDQLWDEAAATTDDTSYAQKYDAIQRKALGEPAFTPAGSNAEKYAIPYVWLLESSSTRAWRGKCAGFNNQNTGLFMEGAYCGT